MNTTLRPEKCSCSCTCCLLEGRLNSTSSQRREGVEHACVGVIVTTTHYGMSSGLARLPLLQRLPSTAMRAASCHSVSKVYLPADRT